MTYKNALIVVGAQTRNLKKIRDIRVEHDGYEYRIKYFGGFGAHDCWTAGQVMERARQKIGVAV